MKEDIPYSRPDALPERNRIRLPVYALLALCIFFSACYQPESGCLDINAVNFDASADKSCCCTYPRLLLTINQVYDPVKDSLIYHDNEAYSNDFGPFILKTVVFYLSEVSLRQNGITYHPTDTLSFKIFGPSTRDTLSKFFVNDFMLVRRTDSGSKNLGTFRQNGAFDNISFRVGLSDAANKIIPIKAPAANPLHDSLWISRTDGFTFARVIFAKDTVSGTAQDTVLLTAHDAPGLFIDLPAPAPHTTGYDYNLTLTINYYKLFKDINWAVRDPATWKMKILANFQNACSISH
jgi:hypothetical protein